MRFSVIKGWIGNRGNNANGGMRFAFPPYGLTAAGAVLNRIFAENPSQVAIYWEYGRLACPGAGFLSGPAATENR
jgi:hypothetical protein